MVEAFAQRLSFYLVSVHAAKDDDREVIAYGLFHIFSSTLQIIILAVTAFLFGWVLEITAFTIFFGSLKRYAGGAHANRHWVCLWGFTALANGSCFVASFVPAGITPYAAVVATALTLMLVLLKAPVMHPNNPKTARQIKKFRKSAVVVAAVQFTVLLMLVLIAQGQAHVYILCGAVGGFAAAITLLLPIRYEKREEVNI